MSSLARAAFALPVLRPGLSAPAAPAPLRALASDPPPPATRSRDELRLLRRSLRANIAEGAVAEIFTACASGAVVTGWALHLGASPVLVGALSALPLAAQVMHLPAAWLTDRSGRRRLAILAVSASRLVWAAMALLAVAGLRDTSALALLVAVVGVSSLLSVIGNNAWTAWMGDLVPSRLRGRFFGTRTAWVTFAGGLAGLVAGTLLDGLGHTHQRMVLSGLSLLAALSGVATAALMARQIDPAPSRPSGEGLGAFARVLRDPRARPLLLYQLAWGVAIAPAASYWSLYLLDALELGFLFIAGHGVLAALVRILTVGAWGRAVDRFGARPVLAACSMGIAVMPLLWLSASPGFVLPLVLDAAVAGCLWGGHGVAAMDLPLSVAPRRERPFYLAAFSTAAGVGLAASSTLSSSLVALAPSSEGGRASAIELLFVASSLGRFACGLLALRLADAKDRGLRELLRGLVPQGLALARRR